MVTCHSFKIHLSHCQQAHYKKVQNSGNAVNDYFGCNLKSLINWYRVQYAKMMLDKRIYRLKDIPYICGFSSKSTFYVAFKRCEGMTPNQYLSTRKEDSERINSNDNNNILKSLNLKF